MNTNENGSISLSGRDEVMMYAWFATRRALAFEIKTGMKMTRVSALQSGKRNGFIPPNVRTKQKALDHMNAVGASMDIEPI